MAVARPSRAMREGQGTIKWRQRESKAVTPSPHKFKVQMYDFSCEGLEVEGRCDPYLKIDFDNVKIFKTDHEANNLNPEWGFKAGFQYMISYLEKLSRRELRVQCFNQTKNNELIGAASVDLKMVACGPAYFKFTLRDPMTREARGILRFTCVMKLVSPNLTVICKDLQLTMQGFPAPGRLNISSTLGELERHKVVVLPHSAEGAWAGPWSLTFETTLGDLLKAPACELLRFEVIDEMGVRQGEALLAFRKAFSTVPGWENSFKVPVTYTCTVDGEDKLWSEPVGAVGELEGVVVYQNLPVYAQMAGGISVDGEVEGGFWLIEGLPFPDCMQQPPPVWQDGGDHTGVACLSTEPQLHEADEGESKFDDEEEDRKMFEALEQIDLPPPWEKRSSGGRLYFADPRSRRTTWKDPRFLPENWDQRIDSQTGKVYYQYHKTRQTTYVDPRGCPPFWDMRLSKNGEIYFAYHPAQKTTFIDPRGLPEHVEPALDDFARMYFKNHECKATTWEDPRSAAQEVTLTKWRQAQATRWWKEQIWRELEDMMKQRSDVEAEARDDEERDDGEMEMAS